MWLSTSPYGHMVYPRIGWLVSNVDRFSINLLDTACAFSIGVCFGMIGWLFTPDSSNYEFEAMFIIVCNAGLNLSVAAAMIPPQEWLKRYL